MVDLRALESFCFPEFSLGRLGLQRHIREHTHVGFHVLLPGTFRTMSSKNPPPPPTKSRLESKTKQPQCSPGDCPMIDLLVVINQLNRTGSGQLPVRTVNSAEPYYVVNGDGFLLPNDVLLVGGYPCTQSKSRDDGASGGCFASIVSSPARKTATGVLS